MDATKYFRIISVTKGVMHFEMMGFWSDEVVDQIGGAFLSRLKEAIAEASSAGKFIVLADFTDLNVLSQKARCLWGRWSTLTGFQVVDNILLATGFPATMGGIELTPYETVGMTMTIVAEIDERFTIEVTEHAGGVEVGGIEYVRYLPNCVYLPLILRQW